MKRILSLSLLATALLTPRLGESGASVTRVSVDAAGAQGIGGDCNTPSISSSGRYIGFVCAMNNLVAGDSNVLADMFVKDQVTGAITLGAITLGSITDALTQANAVSSASARALSDDGFMLFSSASGNFLIVSATLFVTVAIMIACFKHARPGASDVQRNRVPRFGRSADSARRPDAPGNCGVRAAAFAFSSNRLGAAAKRA